MKVGDKYETNEGCEVEVVEYKNCGNVLIKFLDNFGHQRYVQAVHLREGRVKNPYHRSVAGVGYIGFGDFSVVKNKKLTKEYICWKSMVERCHDELVRSKRPTYKDVSLCEEWHNFQNFAKWHVEQTGSSNKGWHLDKDLLIKNNKVYCPEACVFIPQEINSFLAVPKKVSKTEPIGVYFEKDSGKYVACCHNGFRQKKIGRFDCVEKAYSEYASFKELLARKLAIEWKDYLDKRAFEALMNYKTETED